jgi:DNA invertase Pin-like site-specific DNA recombinase
MTRQRRRSVRNKGTDAIIYCRVSTKRQAENLSLPEQERRCRHYCAESGWPVDRVFVEAGASARTADRPELRELLEYVARNSGRIRYVVVYDVSRTCAMRRNISLCVLLSPVTAFSCDP